MKLSIKDRWHDDKNVADCEYKQIADCPHCGFFTFCEHEKNHGNDCKQRKCPRLKGKKWIDGD